MLTEVGKKGYRLDNERNELWGFTV